MFLRKKGMVDMQNMLAQFCMSQLGFGPVGEIHMLSKSGQNSHNYFRDKINDANFHQVVSRGEAALVTKRNDVLLVCPSSHVWYGDTHSAANVALTWDKQNTHMIGMAPGQIAGRARFGHSGQTMANFMTVSGHNNLFSNLYWMHGSTTGAAADLTVLTISGSRNVFRNCHFGGPNDVTQAATAGYKQIVISGSQNQFINCTWGGFNLALRNAANCLLSFEGTGIGNLFDNCTLFSRTVATTPYWISAAQTNVSFNGVAHFKNTQFINTPGTLGTGDDIAVAINFASDPDTTGRYFSFDANCHFSHTTDLHSSGHETGVVIPTSGDATTLMGLMSIPT